MDTRRIRALDKSSSHSLLEFLLGNDTHPGWLDKQSHYRFARVELSCPDYPGDQAEKRAVGSTTRGVWHGGQQTG